ncbi:hypothetical protein [Dyella mobilis]|uniref:Uncharacterized protein n=1 Tax=Dyella mobilis TaxID=1849582 RepID=A0ABS2KET2_9GAMM|nr:hypothetical protein [Dyella mobilis]MBM7129370.1 hypothetical protein [Dyella mobilis]GLQ98664.1 hypothetical protein GCM10007863_30840 [Dyella mobilis]
MQLWQRRTLGALALGGSFVGLSLGFEQLFNPVSVWDKLLLIPFLALYGWGIWSGVALLENANGALRLNRRFWAVQIPFLSSPIAGYMFASGCLLYASFYPADIRFHFDVRFGSQFGYSLLQFEQPWAFGINLFAVCIYTYLTWCIRHEASAESLRSEIMIESTPSA